MSAHDDWFRSIACQAVIFYAGGRFERGPGWLVDICARRLFRVVYGPESSAAKPV